MRTYAIALILMLSGCAGIVRDFHGDTGICPSELHVGYGRISSNGVLDPEVMLDDKKYHRRPENTKWKIGGDSNMGSVTLVFDLTEKKCAE